MAGKRDRLSGNEAIAIALRQINPDVFPAFPITPSTEIPQYFASFVANGQVDTESIPVESEHSSMSAAIGASAAGARSLTATSSCGLAYMWEELYIAASNRLPLALALVNRALSGPININCDHSDSMGARDAGWIQIYAENNQEAYDNMVQAFRISEHKDVRLPIMICQDGFITSHAVENIELLEDADVKNFVGEYELSGRKYGLFEEYRMEDAERAVVIIGSAAGTTKDAVDRLREQGEKVGLIKIRLFRPFPADEIAEALKNVKAIAIMDRAESYTNHGGPLGADVMSALFRARSQALAINYVYGLGGRDVRVEDMENVYETLKQVIADGDAGEMYRYMGIRE